jgi:hypothetical protein
MTLAQRAGLADLVAEHVRISRRCGVNAQLKVPCLIAGLVAGADSIEDMDLLRHGAMPALFGGIGAPSTLGSFLRAFTCGNVLPRPPQKRSPEFTRWIEAKSPVRNQRSRAPATVGGRATLDVLDDDRMF